MQVPLSAYLILAAVLFSIGIAAFLIKRNVISIFMSIELMLNAVNLTFVAFAHRWGIVSGQIFVFFVMVVAAAEAAVGLAGAAGPQAASNAAAPSPPIDRTTRRRETRRWAVMGSSFSFVRGLKVPSSNKRILSGHRDTVNRARCAVRAPTRKDAFGEEGTPSRNASGSPAIVAPKTSAED